MRTLIAGMSAFVALACAWLLVMYLILRHPGFEWRAAMSAGFIGVSLATIVAAWHQFGAVFRSLLAAAAVAIAVVAVSAIIDNNRASNPHGEAFVDVIGLALLAQAGGTLWLAIARPGLARTSAPR
jgi:hypothetical protein